MEVPGDDGRAEDVVKPLLRNPNPDIELSGWEQSEHVGDGALHRIPSGGRHALPHDGGVEGLDAEEHVAQRRELAAGGGAAALSPEGDELVGEASASSAAAGDDAAEQGLGGGEGEEEARVSPVDGGASEGEEARIREEGRSLGWREERGVVVVLAGTREREGSRRGRHGARSRRRREMR